MKRRRFRWIREKERFDEDAGKGTPQREEMAVRLSSGQVLLYPAIHRGIAHSAQCTEQFRVHQSAEDRAFASVILAVEVGFGASERAIGVRIEVDRDKDRGWSRRCDPGLLLYASGLDRVPGTIGATRLLSVRVSRTVRLRSSSRLRMRLATSSVS